MVFSVISNFVNYIYRILSRSIDRTLLNFSEYLNFLFVKQLDWLFFLLTIWSFIVFIYFSCFRLSNFKFIKNLVNFFFVKFNHHKLYLKSLFIVILAVGSIWNLYWFLSFTDVSAYEPEDWPVEHWLVFSACQRIILAHALLYYFWVENYNSFVKFHFSFILYCLVEFFLVMLKIEILLNISLYIFVRLLDCFILIMPMFSGDLYFFFIECYVLLYVFIVLYFLIFFFYGASKAVMYKVPYLRSRYFCDDLRICIGTIRFKEFIASVFIFSFHYFILKRPQILLLLVIYYLWVFLFLGILAPLKTSSLHDYNFFLLVVEIAFKTITFGYNLIIFIVLSAFTHFIFSVAIGTSDLYSFVGEIKRVFFDKTTYFSTPEDGLIRFGYLFACIFLPLTQTSLSFFVFFICSFWLVYRKYKN